MSPNNNVLTSDNNVFTLDNNVLTLSGRSVFGFGTLKEFAGGLNQEWAVITEH